MSCKTECLRAVDIAGEGRDKGCWKTNGQKVNEGVTTGKLRFESESCFNL